MTTWPLQRNVAAFYGEPRSVDFERDNIVYVKPPFRMTYDGRPMTKGVRVHRKCAESLRRVYAAIWEAYGRSQADLDATGFTKCAGGFVIRNKRGGRSLSMHAYGAAVDHDPENNGRGDTSPAFANHPRIVQAFAAEGWEWGGDWSGKSCDGMHWQAAWTKAKPARVNGNPGGIRLRESIANTVGMTYNELFPPPKPLPRPKPAGGNGSAPGEPAWSKEDMERIQERLKELGYYSGDLDGRFGTLTAGAVTRMHMVNNTTGPVDSIPRSVAEFVLSPGVKPMAVSTERATATPAEIATKVPEAKATRWAFLTNAAEKVVYVGGAAVAYFNDTTAKVIDGLPEPIRDAVKDIPSGAILTGAAVIAVASVFMALRAGRTVESAYKRGRL